MPRLRKPPQEEQSEPEIVENAATEDGGRMIELADGATDGVTVELEPAPAVEKKEEAPPVVQDDNPVQRAADATKRAEELARQNAELIRQRNAALAQARERDGELSRERNDRLQAEYDSVLNAIGGQQAASEKAQADYEAALAAQDYKAAGEAQRRISRAEANLVGLEDRKAFLDQGRKAEPERQPERVVQQQPAQQQQNELPDVAKEWLGKHPEFLNDRVKNEEIGAVHNYLVNKRRVVPWSPEYFDALDTEFGFKAAPQPQQQQPQQQQPQQRSIPVAAPVSREVPTANGQRASSRQMHLTREEVDIAHKSRPDLPKAQAERLYASNKERLNKMRANGEYRQTSEQNG